MTTLLLRLMVCILSAVSISYRVRKGSNRIFLCCIECFFLVKSDIFVLSQVYCVMSKCYSHSLISWVVSNIFCCELGFSCCCKIFLLDLTGFVLLDSTCVWRMFINYNYLCRKYRVFFLSSWKITMTLNYSVYTLSFIWYSEGVVSWVFLVVAKYFFWI